MRHITDPIQQSHLSVEFGSAHIRATYVPYGKVEPNHYEVLLNLVHMVPSLQLAETALHHKDLLIAERCYAALGDVARARYMQEVGEI
jgi:hypothetical protein